MSEFSRIPYPSLLLSLLPHPVPSQLSLARAQTHSPPLSPRPVGREGARGTERRGERERVREEGYPASGSRARVKRGGEGGWKMAKL
jgi:hypothetical protein